MKGVVYMKEYFKLDKELLFKNNIKDITSISLDRDYKVDKDQVVGNFIISGEYKIHEVSINKEKFNFKIPFKYELKDDIDRDTVNVEISNFVYDYNKDELLVNIEYEISADRKDVLVFDNKESLDEFLLNREVEIVDTRVEELKKDIEEVEVEKVDEEILDRNVDINSSYDEEKIEPDKIVNNITNTEDKFISYKIYKLTESDTIEGLVVKFHTTVDELKEYNDLSNVRAGDKLIIPYYE